MSNTITATINYSSGPTDGAKLSFTDVTKTDPVTGGYARNWTEKPVQVEIEDLRGKEDSVTLDTAGFQYGTHKTAVTSGFYDEQEIKDVYYPESAALIKQVTGASHVVVFDHSTCIVRTPYRHPPTYAIAVRRRTPGEVGADPKKRQPAQFAHVDRTPDCWVRGRSVGRLRRPHLSACLRGPMSARGVRPPKKETIHILYASIQICFFFASFLLLLRCYFKEMHLLCVNTICRDSRALCSLMQTRHPKKIRLPALSLSAPPNGLGRFGRPFVRPKVRPPAPFGRHFVRQTERPLTPQSGVLC
jgi:hypothetical protein